MTQPTWIRTVYLYLFALVGLVISTIGAVILVNLALKAWVFTQADLRDGYYYERPPAISFDKDDIDAVEALKDCDENCKLTETQHEKIEQWLADYEWWEEHQKSREKVDYQKRSRHDQASTAVSMLLVGVPLYLYHWSVIKRDRRRDKKS